MLVAALAFFTVVVAAPVAEELVFRGALVDAWRSRWGLTRAWVASAALFAILHGAASPSTFVFALVMSAARQWSGGLLLPIALHAANNFLPGIAEALTLASEGPSPGYPADTAIDRVGLGLLLLALGLPLPLRVIRRAWASAKAERREDRELAAS